MHETINTHIYPHINYTNIHVHTYVINILEHPYRQTQTQTDRRTDGQTHRYTDTDRQTDTHTHDWWVSV